MKKKLKYLSLPVLAIAGLCVAAAVAHVGSGSLTCNSATSGYTDFPNANNNTVQEQVLSDGAVIYNQPFSFNGPTGGHTIVLSIAGNHTIQLKGSWTAASANGEAGNFASQPVLVSCSSVTVTVYDTTTNTVTQTTPAVTTTQHDITTNTITENHTNTQTVHDTVTQTTPALPAKTVTVNHTTTVIKIKVKHVPRKLTPKQKCLMSGGVWNSNAHNCGFKGTG